MRDAFPDAEVFCVSLDALGGVVVRGAGCNEMTEMMMMMRTMMTAVELI